MDNAAIFPRYRTIRPLLGDEVCSVIEAVLLHVRPIRSGAQTSRSLMIPSRLPVEARILILNLDFPKSCTIAVHLLSTLVARQLADWCRTRKPVKVEGLANHARPTPRLYLSDLLQR